MGHNLEQLGTATLDTFGGLITACNPQDLPEGASPRTWDTDFIVGSVFTRAGLASVYTFARALDITKVVVYAGIATFTYAGTKDPVVNEEFILEGFTGSAQFLNQQDIFVSSVNTAANTFTATVQNPTEGTYSNQQATAVSLSGLFLGPNVPAVATEVEVGDNAWSNPTGILGSVSYASISTGVDKEFTQTPSAAANATAGTSSVPAWTSPGNILSGSLFASVALSNTSVVQSNSVNILANGTTFSIPAYATITGLEVSVQASVSLSGSTNGNQGPFGGTAATGPTWTSSSNILLNTGVTASCTLANGATSGLISAQGFGFTIPAGANIVGIVAVSKRNTGAPPGQVVQDATVKLLKASVAAGANRSTGAAWSHAALAPQTFGSTVDLWGTTWTPAEINSANFGIELSVINVFNSSGVSVLVRQGFVTLQVYYTIPSSSSTGALNVQVATSGVAVGTPKSAVLTAGLTTFTLGSSTDQWGTTLTPSNIDGAVLGLLINASASYVSPSSTLTFQANSLSVTVHYTTALSDKLNATNFTFVAPPTIGVTGIGVSFQAFSSAATQVVMQLLKNGVAVGDPKVETLTTVPAIYTLGAAGDLWGSTWLYSDINSTTFGVQITAAGAGTTSVNDVDMLVYVTAGLDNFNYVKTYVQDNGHIDTLALDASGILWQEDVTDVPGVLSVVLTGILPNTFAQSSTMIDNEYIMFSDLSVGTDRPRVYLKGESFNPLSQVGPGAPPTFSSSTASTTLPLSITDYSVSPAHRVNFTFATAVAPIPGALYIIAGTGNPSLDGFTFSVLGTPTPNTTSFSAATSLVSGSGSGLTATATPTNTYNIASITQDSTVPNARPVGNTESFFGQIELWSSGPGSTTPGFTITCYYGGVNTAENPGLLNSFAKGYAVYVYIVGSNISNGTQQVTGHGIGIPPGESGNVPYFTFSTTSSAYQRYGGPSGTGPNGPGNNGTFQLTLATLTTTTPIANLAAGAQVQIVGATPSGWNNTWTITDALLSGNYVINSSQMLADGVAQFQYSNASATGQPTVSNGQIIQIQGLTNNLLFNTTGVVQAATGSTFQISGFPGNIPVQPNPIPENGQAATFGTKFLFDPGSTVTLGTVTPSPIYGNDTGTGTVAVIGGSVIPIGAGVRQGVCYFITESEYETAPSAPFTFTTTETTSQIVITDLPVGPSNVIARALAFTEAGQNGVAGANFYVIENPVTTTVNGVSTTVPSTIIRDNVTTQLSLSFTDAVLLDSREIDVQGDDLFNLIELGSSGWCVPYSNRMFYGLQLNKVQNFTNLSFDGGYNPNPGGNITPLGWSLFQTASEVSLITSQVTGQSYYVKNDTGSTQASFGMITQSAFQDAYLVPIIKPNTTYSVRVAVSAPSGNPNGTLVIDLVDYSSIGFGTVYGSFSVSFADMTTNTAVFSGVLLTTVFSTGVSPDLKLRVWEQNIANGADVEVDRIEVYQTNAPYLKSQVFGSYPGQPESIDASSTGGVIDTTSENAQPVMGAFVMHDIMYLMKTNSMYSTEDNPNSEPGGWGLHEVSNKVGTIGINSYDVGEEWVLMACRAGIFGFNGGQPVKIMQELWNLWECINWDAGKTIVLRNDIVNKRMYCAIPLPTGINPSTGKPANKQTILWLPNAPYNPTPTSPNVMLMLNYQGLATFEEMISAAEVHTTMFGTLAAVDMKRKWSIWNIATPAMAFILQQDQESSPLYICNGINSSKIYQMEQDKYSDDGVAINSLYTTYGFVNASKAATLPIFGFHAKRYTAFQTSITGGQTDTTSVGKAKTRMLQNTLTPRYPYTVPVGLPLTDPSQDDLFRPINVRGNRMFVEVSTNAVGSWFNISKVLLSGKADAWATLNPTGGGNAGVI